MHALVRRGLTMLRAKRTIEAVVEDGRAFVAVPMVEERSALVADLAEAGILAAVAETPGSFDVRSLRRRLGLSREQFAMRYGLEVETLRNWETGRRALDAAARSYLSVISNRPEMIEEAYAPTPARIKSTPAS